MAILVCPLSRVHDVIAQRAPARLVSLLDPGSAFPTGHGLDHHFTAPIHDITTESFGLKAPCVNTVQTLIEFVSGWDRTAPILIHCWAGISRSTASAFITAVVHNPGADEEEIAWAIRNASATATPNARLVALADAELGRGGRMSRAVAAIGRGYPTWEAIGEAEPFEIPARFDAKAA